MTPRPWYRRPWALVLGAGLYATFGVGMLSLLAGSGLPVAGEASLVAAGVYLAGLAYFTATPWGRRLCRVLPARLLGRHDAVAGPAWPQA